jgi:hypothetical protein
MIGNDINGEPCLVQKTHGIDGIRIEDEPLDPIKIPGLLDERAVPIEEHGLLHECASSRRATD